MAQYLLGRVLVVDTMDDAIAASRRLTGWSKIVTLEGELLSPGGALTGGSLQGKGAHLVGRKGEMDDLRARLPQTKADVERLAAQVEAHVRSLQQLEAERSELLREESRLQAEIASQESARNAAGAGRQAAASGQGRTGQYAGQSKHADSVPASGRAELNRLAGNRAGGKRHFG